MKDILVSIEQQMPTFSKGQRSIARYVLEHYDEAAFMTAARLGAVAGVSESTVVRFATMLGYEGYPEFVSDLGELVKSRLTSVQRVEVTRNRIGDGDILATVMSMDADCVKKSIDGISRAEFSEAVESIVNAETIYCLGVRSSSALSNFFASYLGLTFKNVCNVGSEPSSDIYEQILRINQNDVFVGISFPRYSQRTIQAMEFAKKRGAKIIAITDSERSPLATIADCRLFAKSEILSYVDSLVSPFSVINALLVAVGMRREAELCSSLTELEQLWAEAKFYKNTAEHD